MDCRLEGERGGIRSLRELIEGDHAGAVNDDLRRAGYPGVEWAGTLSLSWWELLEFLKNLRQDSSSSLYRALNPDDYMWADMDTLLLAEIATHTSTSRWLDAVGKLEEIPVEWAPGQYGPRVPEPVEDVSAREVEVDRERHAREVGASLR